MHVARACVVFAVVGAVIGCAPRTPASTATAAPAAASTTVATPPVIAEQVALSGRLDGIDRIAWIVLAAREEVAPISATGGWRINEQGGAQALVRGAGGEGWRVEQRGKLLRVAGTGGDATPWRYGPFVVQSSGDGSFVQYNGKRFRGELWFTPTDSGITVVNRLVVEDYLRGVVPLELGTRALTDRAALEAQTVAARSYTYVRVPAGSAVPVRGWQMTATVTNQVYGGVEVEHPLVNQAIDATAGLVLLYNGKAVDGPYFSACGGRTATPRDAWRDVNQEPSYLQSVDDVDPRTGKPYCDVNPRNHWVEELGELQVSDAVRRALEAQGAQRPRGATVRGVQIAARSASGRVSALVFRTERGDITVPARDVRAVLRDARGAVLSSTYFSVERESRGGDRVTGLTLRGHGNGHGVGMCQWGAIGRARSGQNARTILQHYYPGTTVGFAD